MNSSTSPIWWSPAHYGLMSIMLSQGVVIAVNNFVLVFTILYQDILRQKKENIVILSVGTTDLCYGCGQVSACLGTLYGFLSRSAIEPIFRQDCLRQFSAVFMVFANCAQSTMLLLQSSDRMLAIAKPLYYFGTTVRFSWNLCWSGFAYSLAQTVVLVWLSSDSSDKMTFTRQFCTPRTALKPRLFAIGNTNNMAFGWASVILFGMVLVLYRKHMSKVAPDTQRELQEHLAAQRRVTLSMALSCGATFGLVVMPRLLHALILRVDPNGKGHMLMRMLSLLLYNCNPMLNLYLYYRRHEQIRKGVKMTLKLKQLKARDGIRIEYKKVYVFERDFVVLNTRAANDPPDAKRTVVWYERRTGK